MGSKFNISLPLSTPDDYDNIEATVTPDINHQNDQQISPKRHKGTIIIHEDDDDDEIPSKSHHKGTVVIHEDDDDEISQKGHHKGTIVIHEDDENDILSPKSVVVHNSVDTNDSSDDDEDFEAMGWDIAEIEKITEEMRSIFSPDIGSPDI